MFENLFILISLSAQVVVVGAGFNNAIDIECLEVGELCPNYWGNLLKSISTRYSKSNSSKVEWNKYKSLLVVR